MSRQDWEDLALLDPYWAVLSEPFRRNGRGDRESFLASGRQEVARVLEHGPVRRDSALDFGCGPGRLTHALLPHFKDCLGLDISTAMIDRARRNAPTARFTSEDISTLTSDSFDLVLSLLVLQHIPSRTEKERLISEMVRVLRPGGLLAFQLPDRIAPRHRLQLRPRLYKTLRPAGPRALYRAGLHPIRMSGLSQPQVAALIASAGATMLSTDYLVTK